MYFRLKGIKTGAIAVLTMLSLPLMGQDLIARQAPIDKKMRAVDSVSLQRLIGNEQLQNPAFSLYPEWTNKYVHAYEVELPKEYKIDLRQFCMPTPSRRITSNYGYRASFGRMHKGLDIKVYVGDTIRAAFSGKIRIVASERSGYGKYIVMRHPNGLETVYAHLSKHLVREDEVVQVGDPIGLGGNTGRSTGSHLHFETRFLGQAIDPAELFNFVAQDVTADYYVFRSNGQGSMLAARDNSSDSEADEEASLIEHSERRAPSKVKRTSASSVKIHKVNSGETLSSIAKKRGTSIDKLCKMNRISRVTKIRPGQILKYS